MHIKKFYPKDERFFKVLATAGNIRSIDAHKIDISDTRLKNMMKDHLIKEVSYVNPKHREVESCKSIVLPIRVTSITVRWLKQFVLCKREKLIPSSLNGK